MRMIKIALVQHMYIQQMVVKIGILVAVKLLL